MSVLKQANRAMRDGNFEIAIELYRKAQKESPGLCESIENNIALAKQKITKGNRGVSIVVLTLNAANHLERLFSSFYSVNTYYPFEFIVIDHGSTDNTSTICSEYENKCSVRYINRGYNYSFSDSCNYGADKSSYPHILFINNDIIYIEDVLPKAVDYLERNPDIGAVGVRLEDAVFFSDEKKDVSIQHLGIEFIWSEKRGYYQPKQIRHTSLNQFLNSLSTPVSPNSYFPAVTGAFMLVRKYDFRKLQGFSNEYNYGLEDIDFCLRIGRDLKRKCFCITDMGLQHVEGATRKLDWDERIKTIEQNHRVFKSKWDNYIRDILNKPLNEGGSIARKDIKRNKKKKLSGLFQKNTSIQGSINIHNDSQTIIRGWLFNTDKNERRTAILRIDKAYEFELECGVFNSQLRKKNKEKAWHGFEMIVPLHLVDGKTHQLELLDKHTGKTVDRTTHVWMMDRKFTNFSGFLKHSYTSPIFMAPYRKVDEELFVLMDKLADRLVDIALTLKKKPKVTVIMPVYNREDIVKNSIDSALNQCYENIQLIVVNDGSSDNTAEVLTGIRDKRLKILNNNINRGQCFSLNFATAQADGDFIAYLDSDNTWDTRYIAAMMGVFHELPDSDALYCGQYLFRGSSSSSFAIRFGSFNSSLLVNRNYIDRNAFIHKKTMHEDLGGFDESIKRYVDWDFIIRTSEIGVMYSVPVMLSNYYYDRDDITMTNDDRHIKDLDVIRSKQGQRALKKHAKIALNNPLTREISIIIPIVDKKKDDIKITVETLIRLSLGSMAQIVVVNGSTCEYIAKYLTQLQRQNRLTLINYSESNDLYHLFAQGVSASTENSDIVILAPGVQPTAGTIEVMQKYANDLPECAMVVPQQIMNGGNKEIRTHVPYANQGFPCDVSISVDYENIVSLPLFHDGNVVELSCTDIYCAYMKREIIEQIVKRNIEFGFNYDSMRSFYEFVHYVLGKKIYHVSQASVFLQGKVLYGF
jgi:glycosyltransferase involved in cell wall biosynthesis